MDTLIKALKSRGDDLDFDLDPYSASKEKVEQNRRNVNYGVKTFVDILGASTKIIPGSVRFVSVAQLLTCALCRLLREISVHIGQSV